jgi:hypothetical protein
MLAPIVLFVYNRPWHTRQTIEALQKNDLANDSKLFIYSDAARNENAIPKVNEAREYIKSIDGFSSVTIIERDKNWGLANSIIDGVTKIVNEYGKIIVLEDDLVTSPYFLRFMNEALDIYKDEEKVACIHGYMYPIKGLPEIFFIRGADYWGWATWNRAWSIFENDGQKLLSMLNSSDFKKDKLGYLCSYPKMLREQNIGNIDSWAIRWYYSALLHNMYCLYPFKTLVINIGQDGTGTHNAKSDYNSHQELVERKIDIKKLEVSESQAAKELLIEYHTNIKLPLTTRIKNKLLRLLKVFR